jgi:molecular chaperone GrpE
MSRTQDDAAERTVPPDRDGVEDVEILEVIGLDDGAEPVAEIDPDDVEVVFEESEPVPEPAEAPPVGIPEEVKLRERLLRLHADFENYKKRTERDQIEHVRFATAGLVERILPVLDNFERAVAAARPGPADVALIEGVALIQRQLIVELEAEGLRPMESVGERFNPVLHEAVATDPDSPLPPHTVTEVFQQGYFLHDRVLRPAMVRVRVDESEGGVLADDGKEF